MKFSRPTLQIFEQCKKCKKDEDKRTEAVKELERKQTEKQLQSWLEKEDTSKRTSVWGPHMFKIIAFS